MIKDKDLALIKLDDIDEVILNAVEQQELITTGETVYAIGNAQNYGISISQGIISQKLVNVELSAITITAIQCNLDITDGNSGGGLFNSKGELIGITTFRTKDLSNKIVYGIAFCIPIETITSFVNQG